MQKFTVFTLLVAVLAVVTVADFLSKGYLYDDANELAVPVENEQSLNDELPASDNSEIVSYLEAEFPLESGGESIDTIDTDSLDSSGLEGALDSESSGTQLLQQDGSNEVAAFLEEREFALGTLHSSDLLGIGFKDMDIEEASNDGLLYQLLDISIFPNLEHGRFHMTDGANVFGVLHEFRFETAAKASWFYDSLQQKVGAFSPGVISNATNQFGQRSFFMNDSKRIGTAFLTFHIDHRVFGFSYPKASHEFFKGLISLIIERLE